MLEPLTTNSRCCQNSSTVKEDVFFFKLCPIPDARTSCMFDLKGEWLSLISKYQYHGNLRVPCYVTPPRKYGLFKGLLTTIRPYSGLISRGGGGSLVSAPRFARRDA